jgi:hypothetical protein
LPCLKGVTERLRSFVFSMGASMNWSAAVCRAAAERPIVSSDRRDHRCRNDKKRASSNDAAAFEILREAVKYVTPDAQINF